MTVAAADLAELLDRLVRDHVTQALTDFVPPVATDSVTGLVSLPDAAEWLAVSRSTVYAMMQSGDLPYIRIGQVRRVAVEDLRTYVERHRTRRERPVPETFS